MIRVIAVAACGLTLMACSSMPSFDLPSFGGGAPAAASLAVESDPPGAQASTTGGTSCVTPCRLALAGNGPFTVSVALNGYVPQNVPVRVVQADDPRLDSAEGSSGPRLDPNPVYVELERAPAPAAPHKKKAAPKRPATASAAPPAPQLASEPSSTATVGTSTSTSQPQPQPPSNYGPGWPMPR